MCVHDEWCVMACVPEGESFGQSSQGYSSAGAYGQQQTPPQPPPQQQGYDSYGQQGSESSSR